MTTINQRTALTSAALALALLFTGCSTENSDEKAAEPSAASASATSGSSGEPQKETASESTASPSAEATSHQASEKKYSGGSKAPEGEYRPADEHGPAQNVPVPKIPEGMDVESAEGLVKFVQYWNDARNYGVETGDTTKVRERTSTEYEKGISNFDAWNKLKLSGGWNIGGLQEMGVDKSQIQALGDGFYAVPMNIHTQDAITVVNGEYISHKLSKQNETAYVVKLQFADNGKWYLINISKFEG